MSPPRIAQSPRRLNAIGFAALAGVALLSLFGMGHGAAGSGGAGGTGGVVGGEAGCGTRDLGARPLGLGDCGVDVKSLNWILRSKRYAYGVKAGKRFAPSTEDAVKELQRRKALTVTGVVERETRRALRRSMRRDLATWYGPGLFGNSLACGGKLRKSTVGVAHRTLECGTRVIIRNGGEYLRTKVIDRGPYVRGVRWDLTQRAAERIGMTGTMKLHVGISRR